MQAAPGQRCAGDADDQRRRPEAEVAACQLPLATTASTAVRPFQSRTASRSGRLAIESRGASRGGAQGTASARFQVRRFHQRGSAEEIRLLGGRALAGLHRDQRSAENAATRENGDLIWGGFYVQMHVLRESHLEVYWRKGDFPLDSSLQVRTFLLDEVGNLGFIPLREFGEFQPVRFKQWDAWQAPARGRLSQYDIQYMVFYAPEVDKTYAISTMVVLPPAGIDAHGALRDGFEVHPEIHASGKADEPLPRLLPTPELLSPGSGNALHR